MRVSKSIVLVDDDMDDHEIFRSACATIDTSAKVQGFDNGEEALHGLSKMISLPDVIFLDLNMPRLNGVEVLRLLKKNVSLKNVPVVIYSTSFDETVKDKCHSLGAIEVIEKPSCYDTLCTNLKQLLKDLVK